MDSIGMTAKDLDHLRLFEDLQDGAGLTAADLADLWCCDRSTVYRIFRGESVPSSAMMKQLIGYCPRAAALVLEFYRKGTNFLVFELPEDGGGEIDARLIESLRQTADMLDERRRHMADGEISASERDAEVATIDHHLSQLHTLRALIADQQVSRRRKAKLSLSLALEGKASGGAA